MFSVRISEFELLIDHLSLHVEFLKDHLVIFKFKDKKTYPYMQTHNMSSEKDRLRFFPLQVDTSPEEG